MVYGNAVFAPVSDGSTVPASYTTGKSQFALFRMAPRYISNRQWYWLRVVVSAAYFAYVISYGGANCVRAGNVNGVRPDSFQLLLIRKEGLSIPLQVG